VTDSASTRKRLSDPAAPAFLQRASLLPAFRSTSQALALRETFAYLYDCRQKTAVSSGDDATARSGLSRMFRSIRNRTGHIAVPTSTARTNGPHKGGCIRSTSSWKPGFVESGHIAVPTSTARTNGPHKGGWIRSTSSWKPGFAESPEAPQTLWITLSSMQATLFMWRTYINPSVHLLRTSTVERAHVD
jgi:hypothetical protein